MVAARPRMSTLWRTVPRLPNVLRAVRGSVARNQLQIAPETLAGQRELRTPRLAECHPRLPNQSAPTVVRALPTGRDSSGFRRALSFRASASTEYWSGQPYPEDRRRGFSRRASAPESARRNQDTGNQHVPLVLGIASRLPATQTLTARTSVAVFEL